MKHIKDRKHFLIKESMDLPALLILISAWYINRKESIKNMKNNFKLLKDSFILYCNSMGYAIDNDLLDLEFERLVNQIKDTLKI